MKTLVKIMGFFFKAALLAGVALALSWMFDAGYTYKYISAGEDRGIQELAPSPSHNAYTTFISGTNVLLLGMPGYPYAAPYLTDTIILASFRSDPPTITLTSIPRDFLVRTPDKSRYVKINSLYELGGVFSPQERVATIRAKIEEISGLPIHHTVTIDIQGLEQVIDALGGIYVEVKQDIFDPFFPGPHYSYEPFELEKGWHHLDGRNAVRFARSRYSLHGDFDRIERQQELLVALKESYKKTDKSLGLLVDIVKALEGHVHTTLTLRDIPVFLGALLSPDIKVKHSVIRIGGEGLLNEIHTEAGAYALIPKAGYDDYSEIQAFFSNEK